MLEYIWFGIMIAGCISSSLIYNERERNFNDSSLDWLLASALFLGLAIFISWEKIGLPYWKYLINALPDQGTTISYGTAFVILLGSGVALYFLLTFGVCCLEDSLRKKFAKQTATNG